MDELLILVNKILELNYEDVRDAIDAYVDVIRVELPDMLSRQEFLVGLDILSSEYDGKCSYTLLNFNATSFEYMKGTSIYQRLMNALRSHITGDYTYMKRVALVQAKDYYMRLKGLITCKQRLYNEEIIENTLDLHWDESDLIAYTEGDKYSVTDSLLRELPEYHILKTIEENGHDYHFIYSEEYGQAYSMHVYPIKQGGHYAGSLNLAVEGSPIDR